METDLTEVELTDRQRSVTVGLLKRQTLKEIALDLGISPSTVDEHKRAAMRAFGASNTKELIEAFIRHGYAARILHPEKPTGADLRVPVPPIPDDPGAQDGPGIFRFDDAMSFHATAPWLKEKSAVPEALDGDNAVRNRLALIGAFAGGILLLLIVGIAAFQALSGIT